MLTTAEYGQFSVFISWMGIIAPIVSLNLYCGVYNQGLVKFEKDRNKWSSSLQGLTAVLICIWFTVYFIFRNIINAKLSLTTLQFTMMFILIWLNAIYNFWAAEQRVDFKYKKIAYITIIASLIQPIVGIIFVCRFSNKVNGRIFSMVVTQLFLYGWMFVYQMNRGRRPYSKNYWKYAFGFNLPLIVHYLSMTILSSSDRIMIGKICGNDKAGIYNLGYSVASIMTMFNTALVQTVEPWIYRKIKENKVQDIARIAYACFGLVAIVNIVLVLCAPEVVAVFAPVDYQDAIWVVPAVALSNIFMIMYTFFATFQFYFEKTRYIAVSTLGGAVLNIIMNMIFVGRFGYVAAGYTTLFSYIMFTILHYFFMKKTCNNILDGQRPYEGRRVFEISTVSIVIGLSCMALYNAPLIRYLIMTISIIVCFIYRKKILYMIMMILNTKREK